MILLKLLGVLRAPQCLVAACQCRRSVARTVIAWLQIADYSRGTRDLSTCAGATLSARYLRLLIHFSPVYLRNAIAMTRALLAAAGIDQIG